MEMAGKVCLVTGASAGIGKETALGLANKGATVIMHGRHPARSQKALEYVRSRSGNPNVEMIEADFSEMSEVRGLAETVKSKYTRLDVLVNNAGMLRTARQMTPDGFEYTLALNHLAPFLLTHLLFDLLKASTPSRVVNMASSAHYGGHVNFNNLQSAGIFNPVNTYSTTKLMNVLFTYELARRLAGENITGITTNAVDPGFVATRFAKGNPGIRGFISSAFITLMRPMAISTKQGAKTSIYLASDPTIGSVTSMYFFQSRTKKSSAESYDKTVARRLWDVSAEMLGVESYFSA